MRTMNISQRLESCVRFAHFATTHKLEPRALAELMTLAHRALNAGVIECNTGKSADPQRLRFETRAAELGFGVEWNGLGPTLLKDNQSIYLPYD